MDCNGHGTHVAGIVGARDVDFVGVAPDVILGAYRMGSCTSNIDSAVSSAAGIKALELAYKDGMDIINISWGAEGTWAESEPVSKVVSTLVSKGIKVFVAVTNNGERGLWQLGTPETASGAVGIASFDNLQYPDRSFLASSDGKRDGPFHGPFPGDPRPKWHAGRVEQRHHCNG